MLPRVCEELSGETRGMFLRDPTAGPITAGAHRAGSNTAPVKP